jgi:hypothetical protein
VRTWIKKPAVWPKTCVLRVLVHVNVLLDGSTDMILALSYIYYFGSTVNVPESVSSKRF